MATAAQLVKQISNRILVRAAEAPIPADEAQDILFGINIYMFAQDANGINLGFTELSDLGDTVTVPDGAIMGIIANVAVNMASQFGMTVSPSLGEEARIGLDAMRKLGVTVAEMDFPSILPLGSGNEGDWDTDHFFPDQEPEISTEHGGSISLESN
jgi:hypothetical protein